MPLWRVFTLPGYADRRRAIVLLVLVNVPTIVIMNAIYGLATTPTPGWIILIFAGCLTGQMITLAYWFSLSRDTLWFRLAVLLTTLLGSILVTELAKLYVALQFYYQRDPLERPTITWLVIAFEVAWPFVAKSVLGLALFSLAYAVFLPIRRLRGISLGTVEPAGMERTAKRQFQIYEWMIWTVIVATPLVLVRIATSMDVQPESETRYLYFSLFLFAFSPLVAGWPVFRSALAERYALLWSLAAFVALAGFGWLACEAAFWINLDRLTGGPVVFSKIFSFWPFETFVLSAAASLCLNTLVLRWLGFRVRREAPHSGARPWRVD